MILNIRHLSGLMKDALLKKWQNSGTITDKKILKAFRKIPREYFVAEEHKNEAYEDKPLLILSGQTISQPTTVALMTKYLKLEQGQKVLEIGAGSGYQAAIIANIIGPKGKVISIEFLPELVGLSKKNLEKANIKNVMVMEGDGSKGFEKEAPFDRIIVTAASPDIPPPLIDQLKGDGILLIPVGPLYEGQEMMRIRKINGKIQKELLGAYTFVPLKGKYGYND